MHSKARQAPISLKVNYKDELQLKMSILQKLQMNKFFRHWVVIDGMNQMTQYEICKRYYSYLNEGDLVKFKTKNLKSNWTEKTRFKPQILYEKDIQYFFKSHNKQKGQNKLLISNICQKHSQNEKKLLKMVEKCYDEDLKHQMDGLKVISIFLNLPFQSHFSLELLGLIQQKNNPSIIVNIFTNTRQFNFKKNFNFVDKWVFFHEKFNIEAEFKVMFYRLSKITVKKVSLELKCLDGQLSKKNENNHKFYQSDWIIDQNTLFFDLYYPRCNKIYINLLQFRNLGYQQNYKFELSLKCIDIHETVSKSTKSFLLKPQRDEFERIVSANYFAENEKKLIDAMKIDHSLKFDNVEVFDKVQDLKQLCQKVQIQIKNNTNFVQQSFETEEDRFKMMYSFEI